MGILDAWSTWTLRPMGRARAIAAATLCDPRETAASLKSVMPAPRGVGDAPTHGSCGALRCLDPYGIAICSDYDF
jgi:hypothetical protein